MEYCWDDIEDYFYYKEDIKALLLTRDNHCERDERYKNYGETLYNITTQIKKDIVNSLERIVSIIANYHRVPITAKDMFLRFPKDYSEDIFLMQRRHYYTPSEYCKIRLISLQGYDNRNIPVLYFEGELYNHQSTDLYVAGEYWGGREEELYRELDINSYMRVSQLLNSLIDRHYGYFTDEEWLKLFNANSYRFERK